jgi:hypothetical protein
VARPGREWSRSESEPTMCFTRRPHSQPPCQRTRIESRACYRSNTEPWTFVSASARCRASAFMALVACLSPPPSVLAEGHSREASRVIRGRPYRCQVTAQVVKSGCRFYREGVRTRCGHRLGGSSPARVGSGRSNRAASHGLHEHPARASSIERGGARNGERGGGDADDCGPVVARAPLRLRKARASSEVKLPNCAVVS